jgi:hypothetical protein
MVSTDGHAKESGLSIATIRNGSIHNEVGDLGYSR